MHVTNWRLVVQRVAVRRRYASCQCVCVVSDVSHELHSRVRRRTPLIIALGQTARSAPALQSTTTRCARPVLATYNVSCVSTMMDSRRCTKSSRRLAASYSLEAKQQTPCVCSLLRAEFVFVPPFWEPSCSPDL